MIGGGLTGRRESDERPDLVAEVGLVIGDHLHWFLNHPLLSPR